MQMRRLPAVLTIAGSDSSGGAGIAADLKTFTALGVYGECCITAITAQNTTGVFVVEEMPAEIVRAQLDAVFQDIPPVAVKIGMVSSVPVLQEIADALQRYQPPFVVVDPVMVSTSGTRLLRMDAQDALTRLLFPRADLITPNLPEAETLTGRRIAGREGMEPAARALAAGTKGAVLLKGGHLQGDTDDLLYLNGEMLWQRGARVENPNTHGTGCTLSSAIAAYLARGEGMADAVRLARQYLRDTLSWGLDLGAGSGPVCHMARIFEKFAGKH